MKIFNFIKIVGVVAFVLFAFSSCNNDDDDNSREIIWEIPLSAKFQNPGLQNRPETGLLVMRLHNNTTLEYSFTVQNLTAGDVLTMAHFHTGDVLTNGGIILNFQPTFLGNRASGTLSIRQSLADSLWSSSNEIYFNVHSQQAPDGLVRGQVNADILYAADVTLVGTNQVPPVTTTATGTAAIRLTTNLMLYSKVTVNNLESNDAITVAHIHSGDVGVNGDILITLCSNAGDFGVNKLQTLSGDMTALLMNSNTYVNAHSTVHPTGVVRGQLSNAVSTPNPNPNPNPY